MDFPLPDSPTIPRVSFLFNPKEIFFKIGFPEIEIFSLTTFNSWVSFKFQEFIIAKVSSIYL